MRLWRVLPRVGAFWLENPPNLQFCDLRFSCDVVFFSVVSVNPPKNPKEYSFEHLNRSARFAHCARSLAAVADRMLLFLWRRVVSCVSVKLPQIIEKSTSKLPNSSPKPS